MSGRLHVPISGVENVHIIHSTLSDTLERIPNQLVTFLVRAFCLLKFHVQRLNKFKEGKHVKEMKSLAEAAFTF